MSKVADPVLAKIPEYVKTRGLGEHFFDFLAQLSRERPEYRGKLVLLGSFFVDPAQGYRLFQGLEQLDRKMKASGFADYPEAYFWRPILEGVLTFRDFKDGTADLGDVISANEALDYFEARQHKAEQRPTSTREAEAIKIAKMMLESGAAPPPGRGRLRRMTELIGPIVEMKPESVENVIRDLVRDWKGKDPDK